MQFEPVGNAHAPTISRRLAAMLYESLLLMGVIFATALPFGVVTQTRHAMDNRHALQATLFFVLGVYFVWFWKKGHTLAMKTWHLKVVDLHGARLTTRQATGRYFASWLMVLPPIVVAWAYGWSTGGAAALIFVWIAAWFVLSRFRADRQCLHDVLCGTRMVYVPPKKKPTQESPQP